MKKGSWSILCLCMLLLSGCAQKDGNGAAEEKETKVDQSLGEDGKYEIVGNHSIKDNDSLYELDNDTKVETMYLTVRSGNSSDGTNHTWTEINQNSVYYYEEKGIERYRAEAILQIGNEKGSVLGEYGYGNTVPNATVGIRGQTSSRRGQKSYKIAIKDGKGTYRDQMVINLNKHIGDGIRFRNKLCYDLMEDLPGLMSARTQFVHLYVKDETAGGSGEYEDYGLYTQVEQINKRYLQSHGLDKNGQLYKINFFEFYRYEDVIKLRTDPEYDEKLFEQYIEIKGDNDHSKLIAMLDDVNNYTKPIEETFAKWFDEENLFSWLAFHILAGNTDTQSRNCFLYSPLNIDKWYFISWDNDAAFMKKERELIGWQDGKEWQTGISNYWGNVLFQRVLKSESCRKKLDEKITQYREIMTPEYLKEKVDKYKAVTQQYMYELPDIWYLPIDKAKAEVVMEHLPLEVEENYQAYLDSLEKPQPFFIGVPEIEEGKLEISWDATFDFDEEDILYTVELAQDYSFEQPIFKDETYITQVFTEPLEPGQYFVRVKAKNESNKEQFAFDTYVGEKGNVYGVKCFYVLEDGTIGEDVYEE